jgi:excisionase family DNA binding protein
MLENNTDRLLTIKQAAEKMQVSRQTIYTWIKNGKLASIKTPSGTKRIPENLLTLGMLENSERDEHGFYKIEDISHYEPIRPEPTGLKEKLWFARDNDNWYWDISGDKFLFKVGRSGTGENWAEIIACELARRIGLPHAEYKFAKYKDKLGVITPSFVPSGTGLILGNEILQHIVSGYKSTQRYKQRIHTLSRVMGAIRTGTGFPLNWKIIEGINDAIDVFGGYLMLDAWIANTDRHHENWGVVLDLSTKLYHLAPTFDHASSLGSHEEDDIRKERLMTRDINRSIQTYVQKARSALYNKQTDNNPMFTIDAFKEMVRIRRDPAMVWLKRLDEISAEEIANILNRIPNELMSVFAKEFAKSILKENKRRLLELK